MTVFVRREVIIRAVERMLKSNCYLLLLNVNYSPQSTCMQKVYPRVQELYVGHPDGSGCHSDHGDVVKVLSVVAETWVHPAQAHHAHHVHVAVETLRWGKKA